MCKTQFSSKVTSVSLSKDSVSVCMVCVCFIEKHILQGCQFHPCLRAYANVTGWGHFGPFAFTTSAAQCQESQQRRHLLPFPLAIRHLWSSSYPSSPSIGQLLALYSLFNQWLSAFHRDRDRDRVRDWELGTGVWRPRPRPFLLNLLLGMANCEPVSVPQLRCPGLYPYSTLLPRPSSSPCPSL